MVAILLELIDSAAPRLEVVLVDFGAVPEVDDAVAMFAAR